MRRARAVDRTSPGLSRAVAGRGQWGSVQTAHEFVRDRFHAQLSAPPKQAVQNCFDTLRQVSYQQSRPDRGSAFALQQELSALPAHFPAPRLLEATLSSTSQAIDESHKHTSFPRIASLSSAPYAAEVSSRLDALAACAALQLGVPSCAFSGMNGSWDSKQGTELPSWSPTYKEEAVHGLVEVLLGSRWNNVPALPSGKVIWDSGQTIADVPLLEVLPPLPFTSASTAQFMEPMNSSVGCVLGGHAGLPMTLSVITVAVARRLGLPAWGVNAPGRFLAAIDISCDSPQSAILQSDASVSMNADKCLFVDCGIPGGLVMDGEEALEHLFRITGVAKSHLHSALTKKASVAVCLLRSTANLTTASVASDEGENTHSEMWRQMGIWAYKQQSESDPRWEGQNPWTAVC